MRSSNNKHVINNKMYSILGSELKAIANCNDGPFNEGLKEKLAALKTIIKRNNSDQKQIDTIMNIVAEVVNARITELHEQERTKAKVNGTTFILQDIEASECELILMNIRSAITDLKAGNRK